MAKLVNDPFAPNYELYINNAKMSDEFMRLVSECVVEDNSELISSVTFKLKYRQNIRNGSSSDLLSSKIISPGNLVVVKGGYGNDLQDIGAGYITELEPDFSENGDPVINIISYSQLQKLSTKKAEKGETFRGYRDSQIASIIGERNGFLIRQSDASSFFGIRLTKGQKTRVLKRGSTDLDFLKELAKLNNYELYDKWDGKAKRFVLFFEPSKDRTKNVMKFVYADGDTPYNAREVNGEIVGVLKSFRPSFSISTMFTKYKVFSWNRKTEKKISYTLTMDEFMAGQEQLKLGGQNADALLKKGAATSGAGVRKEAFGENTEIISTRTFTTESEAKEYLINHMKKIAKDFVTGPALINGNQYIQSRQVHTFSGLDAFFDGKYFIKQAKHVFSSGGYTTNLDVRKVAKENL